MPQVGPTPPTAGGNNNPQTPGVPPDVPPSQPRQAGGPGVFGLNLPVNDWEAALLLYGIGLFAVETATFGDVYLIGAWSCALIMFVGTIAQQQREREART